MKSGNKTARPTCEERRERKMRMKGVKEKKKTDGEKKCRRHRDRFKRGRDMGTRAGDHTGPSNTLGSAVNFKTHGTPAN